MRLTFLFILSLLLPLSSFSEDTADEYIQQQRQILGQADRCDLIGAAKIVQLPGVPLQEIQLNMDVVKATFLETAQKRATCYDDALTKLDALLAIAEKQTPLNAQRALDSGLLELIRARRQLTGQLLSSLLTDLEAGIENLPPAENPSETTPIYVDESAKTRELIKTDMTLVMETQRRQLAGEELMLMQNSKASHLEFTRFYLTRAHHGLSRVLLVFEESDTLQMPLLLARLRSEIAPSAMLADEALLRLTQGRVTATQLRHLTTLNRQLKQMMADLELAQEEATRNLLTDAPENVLGALYERLSDLTARLMETLRALEKAS